MTDFSPHIQSALTGDCGHAMEDAIAAFNDSDAADLIAALEKPGDMADLEARRAVFVLGRSGHRDGPDAIAAALPRLGEGGKIAALDALGRAGARAQIGRIAEFADDPEPQVRKFAANALARIGGERAQDTLETMMRRDTQEFLRDYAAKQMKKMK
jgi:HEAT repeat protein